MKVLLNAKNTVIAIIAVIAIGTSFPIYSKAEEGETQILEPKTSGDEVFQEVKYTVEGEDEHIYISGNKKVSEDAEAYKVILNKDEGTYEVEEKEVTESESPVFSTLATTSHTAWVKAITDDPVGVDLATTKVTLSWYDYGSTIGYKSKALSVWSANPSSLGTHWYNDSKSISTPVQSSTKADLKVVGKAAFHNYDFLDNDKITNIRHVVEIVAKNNGTYDYFVDWVRSGESWITLDLDVEVN
ncbi:hypothetical protein KGR20_21350 [Cytobacillus oceanisediminis]|jgi:hypothetical protein|uniref:hypothetical protein n=1 Tax=Bacillaceae TaxID=186817 RepID=UPI0003329F6D|nr:MULTISPECIES: hypothetical protein [Bacillaceae]EOR20828.1 hypothetical protein A499_24679 [Niallia nealsonii AAU1]TQD31977.1 hypothetical protein FKW81_17845 [Rhodobacter capsulatus]HWJ77574.1 hypothetical protein [Niallia sp.]MBZ9536711.1 hypothetical protein [Cytobacillus oceanisediminis]MCM3364806.1 hypothetical protein [Niallia sp. MER TA 168]